MDMFSQRFNLCSCRFKCRFAQVFVRLLEEMWLGRSSSCAPVEARSVLCSMLPQFNNYSQQDAQELLLFLLNALNDDLKKVQQHHFARPSVQQNTLTAGMTVCVCVCLYKVAKHQMHSSTQQARQEQNRNCPTESTIVSHLFEGQLRYTTLCMHCDHQAYSTQAFTVLSLPIPAGILKCSIQVGFQTSCRHVRYRWSSVLIFHSPSTLCRTACRCSSSRLS